MICVVKSLAMLDQFGAERAHRVIFLAAVAVRNDDHGFQSELRCRESDRLTVISAGRRDNTCDVRMRSPQPIHVHDPAAYLKSPDRSVILMFDPQITAGFAGQERPAN